MYTVHCTIGVILGHICPMDIITPVMRASLITCDLTVELMMNINYL